MKISIKKIRQKLLEAYYEKLYKRKTNTYYRIFPLEYYCRDVGLHKLPYYTIEIGIIGDLVNKYRTCLNKHEIDKITNCWDQSVQGVFFISPSLPEWNQLI